MEIGLSLGTNLGDRMANLVRAREEISRIAGTSIKDRASVWETEPVDVAPEHSEASFLNTVLIVESTLAPEALASETAAIESRMGRVRTDDVNAPRVIDLDIIYANGLHIGQPGLTIPHARWDERRFVVRPLAEVRPDLVLPGSSANVREILETLPDSPGAVLFAREW